MELYSVEFTVGEVYPSFHLFSSSSYLGQALMCNGTEYSLNQCDYNPPTSPECFVGNHSAAVVCRQGTWVQHVDLYGLTSNITLYNYLCLVLC